MAGRNVETDSPKAEQLQSGDLRQEIEGTAPRPQEAIQPSTQPEHLSVETQSYQFPTGDWGTGLQALGKLLKQRTGLSVVFSPSR